MKREEALSLVNSWTSNKNLFKHMLAVEAAMGALAEYFGEDSNKWKLLGLVHDADYEKYPDKHPAVLLEELEKRKVDQDIIDGVKAHAWGFNGMDRKPQSKMEWSIYCCDELTGFIVAVTLVRPEKKLEAVTVEQILSKWNKKDFAKGVHREQIELCEDKLGISLNDFIQIVLSSMRSISSELGL
jgi:putative nucleotidyltransferase with HDIG domain